MRRTGIHQAVEDQLGKPKRQQNLSKLQTQRDSDHQQGSQETLHCCPSYSGSRNYLHYPQPIRMSATTTFNERPDTYNGRSSWEDYLTQFELIAELNRWDDYTKAMCLTAHLQGEAEAALANISPTLR